MRPIPAVFLLAAPMCLRAQSPLIQVGTAEPALLDLRAADAALLVPADNRDAAQVEAARKAWSPLIAPLKAAPAARVLLPDAGPREALLLAASQALRAQSPAQTLFIAFSPTAPPLLSETAWGAVDGGALTAEDLGAGPASWRDKLAQAQTQFPGRPWTLWCPSDPGALASTLMGDGARLIVPAGGPAANLAALVPAGELELAGGLGDLTVRNGGQASRWRFEAGAWVPAPPAKADARVEVNAAAAYDLGALLAKMRAAQLRALAAARTVEAEFTVDLRMQQLGGDASLGFRFRRFEQAGQDPELVQEEVRFNGVKAKIPEGVLLPTVEPKASLSLPVSLALAEHYRYEDAGAAGEGRRRVRYAPVDADPLLYRGELTVDEATGRVLEETRERSGLPGTVKDERQTLTYGEPAPGLWRPVEARTFERWIGPDGVYPVQRRIALTAVRADPPAFDADLAAARQSKVAMLAQTKEGVRYLVPDGEGGRKLEAKPRTLGRALAGVVLVDPGLSPPVVPLGGLAFFDFDAFGKGVQLNAIVAAVFNTARIAVPRLPGGFDLSASGTTLLLKTDERPVRNGQLEDRDAVGHSFGDATLGLGHDLGLGFRLEARGDFLYDHYGAPRDDRYATPGFQAPPSGWTRTGTLAASWIFRGFSLEAYDARGQRPGGVWGTAADPHTIPGGGHFKRWGGSVGYTREMTANLWFNGGVSFDAGSDFDRFNAIPVGGGFGGGGVPGIRANALTADRIVSERVGVDLPPSAAFRAGLDLVHAQARALDDGKTYAFTGLGLKGTLPGFWVFTAVQLDLGVGLQSDVPGVKGVNGYVALLRVF
ncbi:MAG TPA: hypothetical protein VL181_05985 [Holophagaceae bacterium]|nr:hypothetical protein [Holophagaceae bacterium]